MKENNIALKSIRELLEMKFFVPSYQRGYRWTEQQVTDLLKDIRDFSKKKSDEYEFYCLQPLVVRQMDNTDKQKNNLEVHATWYEVIDGQQRLTTIYLILFALKDVIKIMRLPSQLYELKYQREANEQNEALSNVTHLKPFDVPTIDSFHLSTAYKLITTWFDEQGDNVNIADFCNVLLKYDPDKNTPQRDKANNIRVIWYESVDENPVNVFTRLNIGKIALSNSELIKALFLNSSNLGDANDHYVRLRQQEIASEWDNIEYTFQNEEFWLLLHGIGYDRPTRIDFIFDLICRQNLFKFTPEVMKSIGTDDYKTFRYFYEYFKTTENVNVVECWHEVKKYHKIFMEWFNDIQFYHYVGYLIECGQHSINRLIDQWMCNPSKTSFLSYLKDEIKNVIERCPKFDCKCNVDGSDKSKYRPILLFHNIQTVINQNMRQQENDKYQLGSFYKFPFHLYKLEDWDVEHINSSTTNEENESTTQKEWLLNVYLSVDSELQKRIQDSIKGGEKSIEACWEEIKKQMFEQEEWTQEDKNRIWNYTLLDSSTNRSYGNALFSGKRRVIISKDRGVLMSVPQLSRDGNIVMSKEPKIKSSFVPPCTKQVFMKYYSCTPGDSNYWLKYPDAQAYMENIEECIRQLA